MTWVVGIPGLMTGAAAMADVRIPVEEPDGSRSGPTFGVQKLHAVAPVVVVGFAGIVELGLEAIECLRADLPSLPEGRLYSPPGLAEYWAPRLRAWGRARACPSRKPKDT